MLAGVVDRAPTLTEVFETLTFRAGFNTGLVVGGTTLLGLAAGVVGVFMMLRKRSLVTDALSHATLPGIVLAFLVGGWVGLGDRSVGVLIVGGALSGVVGVLCIQGILRHGRLGEDAAIGIVLSVFFGAGVVGLSFVQANAAAGSAGLTRFIYGQAATMGVGDVWLMGGLALACVVVAGLLLKEFALVCFNDAFARVDGWPVSLIDLLMMGLVVVVTVAGLQAVGLILVVSMLIVPAVAARFWTERLWKLVLIAGVIGAGSGYVGSVLSALFPRKPAGAVIVLTSGAAFFVSLVAAPARGVVAAVVRRVSLRVRIAGDHVLEEAHVRLEGGRGEGGRGEGGCGEGGRLGDVVDFVARLRGWSWVFRVVVLHWLWCRGLIGGRSDGGRVWGIWGEMVVTDAGLSRGARVARNHALWERYLIRYADVAPSHVDWSVDQVEHVLSGALVRELEADLGGAGGEAAAGGVGGGGAGGRGRV